MLLIVLFDPCNCYLNFNRWQESIVMKGLNWTVDVQVFGCMSVTAESRTVKFRTFLQREKKSVNFLRRINSC
jgi:hypothetical protein